MSTTPGPTMAERSVSEVTDVAVDGLPTLRKPAPQTASDVVDFIKPIHSSPYAVTPGNGRPAPTTLTAAASFAVGDRVAVKGKGAGTVRFSGPHHVEGTPRLGVELDDPTGKNNGTVTGHRYFSCAPDHGALVKPHKATASAVGTLPGAPNTMEATMEAESESPLRQHTRKRSLHEPREPRAKRRAVNAAVAAKTPLSLYPCIHRRGS